MQGHVILAIDGLQPYHGQDMLWVLRDCLSGEVLRARSLASAREADLADLLREVNTALPVPIQAVVSDGQSTIRLAVRNVMPDVPHQLCHYHYLKEAAKPITAADRQARTLLKKYVRGVRDSERSVADRDDAEAVAIRGYCQAVRSALTDDGRPPLRRLAWNFISGSRRSRRRWGGYRKRNPVRTCPPRHRAGVACSPWRSCGRRWRRRMRGWCGPRRSGDHAQADGAAIATAYRSFSNELLAHQRTLELEPFVTHFYKVTMRYWRGLFCCYDVADLPRTNNDLEQYFGSARYLERRATGGNAQPTAMVVRGAVRVVAAVATQTMPFRAQTCNRAMCWQAWRRTALN
jgi:hypothetical protein